MPIKVQSGLPARETLERENVFTMDENRAMHQDIRPIEVGILNLMPLKEETELQILRELSNTPLQVDCTFLMIASHEPATNPEILPAVISISFTIHLQKLGNENLTASLSLGRQWNRWNMSRSIIGGNFRKFASGPRPM